MAWGRKKSGGRKEPRFGLAAALADLRLDPKDRIPTPEDKPRKTATKRKVEVEGDLDDEPPPPSPPTARRPRVSRSASRRRSKSRGGWSLSRLIYWGAVLSLWGAIALVGALVWAGAHLPPIQSLAIPKRPPTLEIVGAQVTV